jgi:hypothetical protein
VIDHGIAQRAIEPCRRRFGGAQRWRTESAHERFLEDVFRGLARLDAFLEKRQELAVVGDQRLHDVE